MMKKAERKHFVVWVSVNDEEYYTRVDMFGKELIVGEPREYDEDLYEYPVYLDGNEIVFDEPVSVEEKED